jgi:2-polyprenyl-3-methyl-5-hydroxy-6-metoxy-1,4-benzoquinol methylase
MMEMKRRVPGTWLGIDMSKSAISKAAEIFPKEQFIFSEDLSDLTLDFDGVVCSEVIEHVEDDVLFVGNLINRTTNTLVVTTPNRHVDDPGHLRVYTKKSLLKLFGSKGVSIESIDTFFVVTLKK